MITSYEQFKSVTASLFNNKSKTLSDMRTAFAKSLGFSSTQGLKEKLDQSNPTTSFVLVIEMADGVLQGTTAFYNTEEGNAKATAHLLALVKQAEGLSDEELAIVAAEGSYSTGSCDYYMTINHIEK